MKTFTAKTFKIVGLKGISAKNIEEHIKLYAGYVKNCNLIYEKMDTYAKDAESNNYILSELLRRFSFEFNGMRNHEVYFASLEGGSKTLSDSSPLKKKMAETWGSIDNWLEGFKKFAATTRGVGWAALWYDPREDSLHTTWIDEQHFGQLQGCAMILGLDMWEHAYVADYQPSGKKQYIEDFFANLNWSVIEDNFKKASK